MSIPAASPRVLSVSAAAVPGAFLLANAVSYALLLVAAHLMSEPDYGKLSSLLGLLLISTIPMLALQTVTARRAATDDGSAGIVQGAAVVAALATAVLAALSPALAFFLHLPNVIGILLVAVTVPGTAVLGTAMGLAQGHRRFRRLAALILAATAGRSAGGLVGLLVGRSPQTTLIGIVIGTLGAALVVAATGRGLTAHRVSMRERAHTGVLRETVHAGYAHGTFLLLTSLDVLLARHVLTSSDAGVYAVGSVVTRATLWLPQSVVMLMFASLAEPHLHRAAARRATAAVAGLGSGCVAGSAILGTPLVRVVGGSKYHRLDETVWLYAVLGALLAVLQLSVVAGLAQRNSRRAVLLWVTIFVDVAVVLATGDDATPTRVVTTLVGVSAVSAVAALWLTLRQEEVTAGHGPGVKLGSSPAPNWDATPEGTG